MLTICAAMDGDNFNKVKEKLNNKSFLIAIIVLVVLVLIFYVSNDL